MVQIVWVKECNQWPYPTASKCKPVAKEALYSPCRFPAPAFPAGPQQACFVPRTWITNPFCLPVPGQVSFAKAQLCSFSVLWLKQWHVCSNVCRPTCSFLVPILSSAIKQTFSANWYELLISVPLPGMPPTTTTFQELPFLRTLPETIFAFWVYPFIHSHVVSSIQPYNRIFKVPLCTCLNFWVSCRPGMSF